MKVKELIERLNEMDGESEVIVQNDVEGNGFSPLAGIDDQARYIGDTEYSGFVYYTQYDASDYCLEEDEWDELLKKPRCVVLFPMN